MGDSGPVDVCERGSERVHGWIGILRYAHTSGLWDVGVCWCGCTIMGEVRIEACICVFACVCISVYTRTLTQTDLYDLYLQPWTCRGRQQQSHVVYMRARMQV